MNIFVRPVLFIVAFVKDSGDDGEKVTELSDSDEPRTPDTVGQAQLTKLDVSEYRDRFGSNILRKPNKTGLSEFSFQLKNKEYGEQTGAKNTCKLQFLDSCLLGSNETAHDSHRAAGKDFTLAFISDTRNPDLRPCSPGTRSTLPTTSQTTDHYSTPCTATKTPSTRTTTSDQVGP